MKRATVFVVQVVWLILLGALAAAFFIQRSLIPVGDYLGPIPLATVWFGALGAVLISLTGIVEHAHDWDPSYDLWHLSRPLVGASLAVVGVLILQAGVLASGSAPNANSGIPKNLFYYLVAFLVGYREETFRELIKRLVDLILAPATTGAAPSITGIKPPEAGVVGRVPIALSGSGFTGTTSVMFGSSPADFHVDSDGQITAQLPPASAAGPVVVSVQTKRGSASSAFKYV